MSRVLEFGQPSDDPFNTGPYATYLPYWLGSPFFHWGYRGSMLSSDARYGTGTVTPTNLPFDLRAATLFPPDGNFVRYQSVHAFWQRGGEATRLRDLATQHEVLLFSRDPEEHFQALAAVRTVAEPPPGPTLSISQGIRIEFQRSRLPDSATLLYPPQPNWNTNSPFSPNPGPVPVFALYDWTDFWTNGAQPKGPASEPRSGTSNGFGSVKAVHVVNHGLCAQKVPYTNPARTGLLDLVAPGFLSAVEQSLARDNPSASVVLDTSDTAAFLHTTTEREDAQHGGFFFHFSGALHDVPVPVIGSLNAQVEMLHAFEFKLLNGVLTVDPLLDHGSTSSSFFGIGAADVKTQLEDALLSILTTPPGEFNVPDTLPGRIYDVARKQQEFAGITLASGFSCEPRGPQDESILAVDDPRLGDICPGLFRNVHDQLLAAVTGLAGQRLGIPQAAFAQLYEATALETMPNPVHPSERIYKNFKCVPRGSTGNSFCRYSIPARRINVFPDAVELVFVDDDKEYTNPSFIPYLILFNLGQVTGGVGLNSLCDPPVAQVPGALGRRATAFTTYDNRTLTAIGCVYNPQSDKYDNCTVVGQ